jgi:hypothetical protein
MPRKREGSMMYGSLRANPFLPPAGPRYRSLLQGAARNAGIYGAELATRGAPSPDYRHLSRGPVPASTRVPCRRRRKALHARRSLIP